MSKDIAEKIVTESLDNAILDMAKISKPKLKKSKIVEVTEVNEVQVLGEPEIISHETIVEVKPVEVISIVKSKGENEAERVKTIKTKNISKVSKKHSKINGFFGSKTKNVSRETLKSSIKTGKLIKSPYWTKSSRRKGSGIGGRMMGRMFNLYNLCRVNAMTGALVVMMLGFVTATTYVTYAYVTSGDADLIGNVAKHVLLPEGEQPKVYIIQSEKADLFTNPLFVGIKVGDNVLTYTKAGKVVIYRSGEDKIVNIVNLR
jgi:hypothetical protein